jgi:hypothetical protein
MLVFDRCGCTAWGRGAAGVWGAGGGARAAATTGLTTGFTTGFTAGFTTGLVGCKVAMSRAKSAAAVATFGCKENAFWAQFGHGWHPPHLFLAFLLEKAHVWQTQKIGASLWQYTHTHARSWQFWQVLRLSVGDWLIWPQRVQIFLLVGVGSDA